MRHTKNMLLSLLVGGLLATWVAVNAFLWATFVHSVWNFAGALMTGVVIPWTAVAIWLDVRGL